MTTAFTRLLETYRDASKTEREKGDYFERLTITFLRNDSRWAGLYENVQPWADWAKAQQGISAQDTGIDLVATTHTGEVHAIQCKFYDPTRTIEKKHIDSFFTASGKAPFARRIIVTTTDKWSAPAEDALKNQQLPVTTIRRAQLESSQIDWAQYQPEQPAVPLKKKGA